MADDMQRLIVSLEAQTKKFENALNKANGVANKRARSIETRFARMNKSLTSSFGALQGVMLKAFAAAAALRGAQQLIDTSTRIENALKVAGLAGQELTDVYDQLFASAQKNAAPLEALVTLYGRAALVQKELGISQQELLGFTDKVALSLRVSGKSATESAGALLQLSQALGSGIVRAEEFNSILEGALPIAQATAAGLDEAGGSVSRLRQLVVDGKVSSEAFFRAFEAGSVILEQKVAGAELTVSQQFTRLQNVLIATAGKFDDATSASKVLGGAIESIANHLENAGSALDSFNAGPLADFINQSFAGASAAGSLIEQLTRLPALLGAAQIAGQVMSDAMMGRSPGSSVASGAADDYAEKRLRDAFNFPEDKRTPTTGRIKSASAVKTVSLSDFAPPSGKKKSGSSRGKSPGEKFDRELEQIRQRTAALQAETEAQRGLNPLVDDYGYATEKVRIEQDLLSAAQKAGLQVTPELRASISDLAEGYAQASVEAAKLAENQDAVREAAEDFKQTGKDVMSGFISDLRSGKSASEALANALNKVADKLLDVALNSAFGIGKAGGGGGGFLGSIFSGIGKFLGFAQGGYTGNGGKNEPAGIVHKGEYVMDADTTKRIGVRNLRKLQGYSSGGLVGSAPSLPSLAAGRQQAGGHITVSGEFGVQNGNIVPLVTVISGQVAGQQIKQVNRNLQGRLRAVQTRGT